MVTVYVAGCTAGKLKNPELFDTVSRLTVDASFMRTTVAPGITAPVESVTVPLMDPLADCASAGSCKTSRIAKNNPAKRKYVAYFFAAENGIGLRLLNWCIRPPTEV